jgi:protein TonB
MKLDAWTSQPSQTERVRRKRLTVGYTVGAGVMALLLSVVTYSAHGRVFEDDDTIDVSLASAPVVSPLQEPEVAPTPPPVSKPRARPRRASLALAPTPKQVPDSVPDEADPSRSRGTEGDLDDLFQGENTAPRAQARAAPAKAADKSRSAAPPPPLLESELGRAIAPVALKQPAPEYPEEARKMGVEGTVVVRFVVGPNGQVTRVKILKGHPLLNPAALEAVRAWRFQAGTYEGQPVAMWRSARFPFRLTS